MILIWLHTNVCMKPYQKMVNRLFSLIDCFNVHLEYQTQNFVVVIKRYFFAVAKQIYFRQSTYYTSHCIAFHQRIPHTHKHKSIYIKVASKRARVIAFPAFHSRRPFVNYSSSLAKQLNSLSASRHTLNLKRERENVLWRRICRDALHTSQKRYMKVLFSFPATSALMKQQRCGEKKK